MCAKCNNLCFFITANGDVAHFGFVFIVPLACFSRNIWQTCPDYSLLLWFLLRKHLLTICKQRSVYFLGCASTWSKAVVGNTLPWEHHFFKPYLKVLQNITELQKNWIKFILTFSNRYIKTFHRDSIKRCRLHNKANFVFSYVYGSGGPQSGTHTATLLVFCLDSLSWLLCFVSMPCCVSSVFSVSPFLSSLCVFFFLLVAYLFPCQYCLNLHLGSSISPMPLTH